MKETKPFMTFYISHLKHAYRAIIHAERHLKLWNAFACIQIHYVECKGTELLLLRFTLI